MCLWRKKGEVVCNLIKCILNPVIIRKIKMKALLHKRYKRAKLQECRSEVKKAIELTLEQYRKIIEASVVHNPMSFWNFITY